MGDDVMRVVGRTSRCNFHSIAAWTTMRRNRSMPRNRTDTYGQRGKGADELIVENYILVCRPVPVETHPPLHPRSDLIDKRL